MGECDGADIPRFFDRHSEDKRNNHCRNILKGEGHREPKHERCREVDMGDIE
jgi:hypothetical protein